MSWCHRGMRLAVLLLLFGALPACDISPDGGTLAGMLDIDRGSVCTTGIGLKPVTLAPLEPLQAEGDKSAVESVSDAEMQAGFLEQLELLEIMDALEWLD